MPRNVIIDINDSSGQTVFSPQTQTVTTGDLIYWRNNTKNMLELVLKSKPNDPWGPQIPGKLDGQPAPVSQRAMVFGVATAPTGVDYMIKLSNPQVTGTIIAKAPPQ